MRNDLARNPRTAVVFKKGKEIRPGQTVMVRHCGPIRHATVEAVRRGEPVIPIGGVEPVIPIPEGSGQIVAAAADDDDDREEDVHLIDDDEPEPGIHMHDEAAEAHDLAGPEGSGGEAEEAQDLEGEDDPAYNDDESMGHCDGEALDADHVPEAVPDEGDPSILEAVPDEGDPSIMDQNDGEGQAEAYQEQNAGLLQLQRENLEMRDRLARILATMASPQRDSR